MLLSNRHAQVGLGHEFDVEPAEEGWSQGSLHNKAALIVEDCLRTFGGRRRCSSHVRYCTSLHHDKCNLVVFKEHQACFALVFKTELRMLLLPLYQNGPATLFFPHGAPCTHAKLRFTAPPTGASGQSLQQRETSDQGGRITDRDYRGEAS
jgi:hypothetical protein